MNNRVRPCRLAWQSSVHFGSPLGKRLRELTARSLRPRHPVPQVDAGQKYSRIESTYVPDTTSIKP